MKKLRIDLHSYLTTCGDAFCTTYGTIVTINDVVLEGEEEDTSQIVEKILKHLGYKVDITESFNYD